MVIQVNINQDASKLIQRLCVIVGASKCDVNYNEISINKLFHLCLSTILPGLGDKQKKAKANFSDFMIGQMSNGVGCSIKFSKIIHVFINVPNLRLPIKTYLCQEL